MKTRKNRSFNPVSRMSIMVITAVVIMLSSCKSPEKKKVNYEKKISKKMEQVKSDVHDVVVLEKNEMESKADSVITDFNNQLDKLEENMKKENKELNLKSEELLTRLKAERDTLKIKLNEIEKKTDKDWDGFKTVLNNEIKQFSSGVKDFFRNNK